MENLIGKEVVTEKDIYIFNQTGSIGGKVLKGIQGKVIDEKMLRTGYCWVIDFTWLHVYIDKQDFFHMFKLHDEPDTIYPII